MEGSGKNDTRKRQRSCRRRGFPWRPLDATWERARPTAPNARLGAGRRARGRWQDRVDWISSSSFAQTLSTYVHQGHCAVACSCFSGCTQNIQPAVLCLLAQDVNWPGGLQSARHSLAVFFCTNLAVELGVSLHVSLSLESHCPLRFARPPRARLRASLTKSPLQQTYALLTGSRRSGWLGPSGAHFWDLECGTGRREARRRLECEGVRVCSNTPGR